MNTDEIKRNIMGQAASFEQNVQREIARLTDDRCFPNDKFRAKLGGGNPTSAMPLNNTAPITAAQPAQQPSSQPMSMAEKILALRGASHSSVANYRKN